MAVNYSPFESKTGFKSPGFSINPTGTLEVTSIVTPIIETGTVVLNGIPLGGSASLDLYLEGNFSVSEGSTPYISIANGQVSIRNRDDGIGTIDNMDIGAVISGTGRFTTLIADSDVSFNGIDQIITLTPSVTGSVIIQPDVTGSIDNMNVGVSVAGTGKFTSLTLTQEATGTMEVPTKGYVDTKISAFSIAFGA